MYRTVCGARLHPREMRRQIRALFLPGPESLRRVSLKWALNLEIRLSARIGAFPLVSRVIATPITFRQHSGRSPTFSSLMKKKKLNYNAQTSVVISSENVLDPSLFLSAIFVATLKKAPHISLFSRALHFPESDKFKKQ